MNGIVFRDIYSQRFWREFWNERETFPPKGSLYLRPIVIIIVCYSFFLFFYYLYLKQYLIGTKYKEK